MKLIFFEQNFDMRYILPLIFSLYILSCGTKNIPANQTTEIVQIGFYNVENLFDTIDNPQKQDDDFTPEGRNKYSTDRYRTKLQNITRVLTEMGLPEVIGFCEVENRAVLEDLMKTGSFADFPYEIVHFESPDDRGIDNALVYRSDIFKVVAADFIRIIFPDEMEEDATRDVLVVRGQFSNEKDILILVNHWPSRRGGVEASEPKRMFVAGEIMKMMDSLENVYSNIPILLMGDFNDEPLNNSILKKLQAGKPVPNPVDDQLYNLFHEADQQGLGTYNYRGNWNLMDHFIVSGNLLNGNSGYKVSNPIIFKQEWMLYQDKRFGPTPSRTYGGPNYYGGYSDHLPIRMDLEVRE